jgi:hypothetical protein
VDERALVAEMRLVVQQEVQPLKDALSKMEAALAVQKASVIARPEFTGVERRLIELEKEQAADRARARIWTGVIGVLATVGGAALPEALGRLFN